MEFSSLLSENKNFDKIKNSNLKHTITKNPSLKSHNLISKKIDDYNREQQLLILSSQRKNLANNLQNFLLIQKETLKNEEENPFFNMNNENHYKRGNTLKINSSSINKLINNINKINYNSNNKFQNSNSSNNKSPEKKDKNYYFRGYKRKKKVIKNYLNQKVLAKIQ